MITWSKSRFGDLLEILVKDQRLAAGDSRFLAKMQKRMGAFASGARVVVSHPTRPRNLSATGGRAADQHCRRCDRSLRGGLGMTSLGEKNVVVPTECMLRIKHTGAVLDF